MAPGKSHLPAIIQGAMNDLYFRHSSVAALYAVLTIQVAMVFFMA